MNSILEKEGNIEFEHFTINNVRGSNAPLIHVHVATVYGGRVLYTMVYLGYINRNG